MNLLAVEYKRIQGLGWEGFFKELPAYLLAKAAVKRQTIAPGLVVCSLYINPTKFSVWMEK